MESSDGRVELPVCGKSHPDTRHFDDAEDLQGAKDVILKKIIVIYGEFVFGIRCDYKTSNKKLVKTLPRWHSSVNPKKEHRKEIVFNNDEYIINITGRHGDVIDHVIFHTNKGRELRFGESDGGEPFDMKIPPGFQVKSLKGGYGGHLHNIGCNLKFVKGRAEYLYTYKSDKNFAGRARIGLEHDDTKISGDLKSLNKIKGQHRITKITVYYNSDYIKGMSIEYKDNGELIKTK